MRPSVALGLFLAIAGFMILVLKPVYETAGPDRPLSVEAVGPVKETRPIPDWVGVLALLGGGGLLLGAQLRRR